MMRICVIGDSHIAALKAGWNLLGDEFADLQPAFFGAPGQHMKDLAESDNRLAPTTERLRIFLERTSGGVSAIESTYDRYLICGLGLSVFHASFVYKRFRAESHTRDDGTPVSDDCFSEALCGRLRTTLAAQTLAKLRQVTNAPAGMIANPLPGDNSHTGRWEKLAENGDDRSLANFFAASCGRIAHEGNALFLPQPAETLGNNTMTTLAVYTEMAERFFSRDDNDDRSHMNAAFGAIVLRHALARFAGGTSHFDTSLTIGPRADRISLTRC